MHFSDKNYIESGEPKFPENWQLYPIFFQARTRSNGDLGNSNSLKNRIWTEDSVGVATELR